MSTNYQTNSDIENDLNVKFTFQESEKTIRQLKLMKAPGIDDVRAEHLRYCRRQLIITLTKLFNAIFTTGYIPKTWKCGMTIPIYKGRPKARTNPDSYIPISLIKYSRIINNKVFKNIWVV